MSQNKSQNGSPNDSHKKPSREATPGQAETPAGGQAQAPVAKADNKASTASSRTDPAAGSAKPAASQSTSAPKSGGPKPGAASAPSGNKPSSNKSGDKTKASGKTTVGASGSGASGSAGRSGGGAGGAKNSGKNIALLVAVVALVVALLGVATAAWLYVQGQSRAVATDQQIESATANVKSQVQQELGPQVRQIGQSLSDVSDRLAGIDKRVGTHDDTLSDLQSTLGQIRQQNSQLQDALGGNNDTFIQQRVAALLETAQQRLTIYRDPQGTLAALKSADQIIARSSAGQLRPVREAIAQEIAAVRSLPNPDIEGLALQLSQLVERVPNLATRSNVPDDFDTPAGGDSASGSSGASASSNSDNAGGHTNGHKGLAGIDWSSQWQRLSQRAGQALSSMVSVRRANGTQDAPTLMAPDQAFFLVENVQLSLKSARLALLAGNENAYTASLSEAAEAIRRYFDPKASATQGMLSSIDELKRVELAWKAPHIGGSLERLNRIMRENASSQAPEAGNDAGAQTGNKDARSANDNTTDGAADQGGA